MPAPNLAPILAPASKTPSPLGHDRESGPDDFALLLALLAGAPASTGGAAANPSPPAAGADAPAADRGARPAITPAGVASALVGETLAGRAAVAKPGLGHPGPEGKRSSGPTGAAAAGDPSEAASPFGIPGSVLPGAGALASELSAAPPSSSPDSSSRSTGVALSSPLATASRSDFSPAGSAAGIGRSEPGPIPNLAPSRVPVTGAESTGPAVEPAAPADRAAGPVMPPASPASGPFPVGEPAGPLAGPAGSLFGAATPVARSADTGPALSLVPGSSTKAGVETASEASSGLPSRAPHRAASDTNRVAPSLAGPSLGDPADGSAPGGPLARPSQPLTEGAGVAAGRGRAADSAALAAAGGDAPAAIGLRPDSVADPAGSPGERAAAVGGAAASAGAGREGGGSTEEGVGGGGESQADPGSSLAFADGAPAPLLDATALSEPAPAGRAADPVASPPRPGVPVPQPPAVQVAATLLQRGGVPIERLRIALEPAELGSVELTLTSESRRKARAILLVERPETLELLQRDQQTLERILVASGLELENGGLELGLRRDGEGRPESFAPPGGARSSEPVRSGAPTPPPRLLDLRLLDLVV